MRKWLELSVQAPREFVEPLTSLFLKYGHAGVAVEEPGGFNPDEGESPPDSGHVRVMTYLPVGPTTRSREGSIDVGVRLMAQLGPVSKLHSREVDEAEWQYTWREHFHTLHVGSRTVIVPTWRSYTPSPGDVVIELDPGMAFGTGHHPTTTMCLAALEELVSPGCSVLDLGCGSGILSIAAAKLGASEVLGLDIDPTAVETAAANVKQNGVDAVVTVDEGTLPYASLRPGRLRRRGRKHILYGDRQLGGQPRTGGQERGYRSGVRPAGSLAGSRRGASGRGRALPGAAPTWTATGSP